MIELESNNLTLVCVLNHCTVPPHGDLRDSASSYEHKTWPRRNKSPSKHIMQKEDSKMTAKLLAWANGRKTVSMTKMRSLEKRS